MLNVLHRKEYLTYVQTSYFINNKLSETDVIKMLECLIDSIFVMFDGHVFQNNGHMKYGFQLPSCR